MSPRGSPRTIMVNRGVRYNWRESLESILEDGELSKFSVKPSGTLHLYVTRPKKNKPRSHKSSTKKKKKKNNLCAVLSWIHSTMLNPWNNKRLTVKDQCVQTDCTIPICFEVDETDERCPCGSQPRFSNSNGNKLRKGYFPEPSYHSSKKPTNEKPKLLQRNLAVPKTKPRLSQRKQQSRAQTMKESMTSTQPELPRKSSGNNEKPTSPLSQPIEARSSESSTSSLKVEKPSSPKLSRKESPDRSSQLTKGSIHQVGSSAGRKNTVTPNNPLLPDKNKSSSPQPPSTIPSSSPRTTRDSSLRTAEGPRKSGLASQSRDKIGSADLSKPRPSKSPERTPGNPLKPTVGMVHLPALNQSPSYFNSHSLFKFDIGQKKSPNKQRTSRRDKWDLPTIESLHKHNEHRLAGDSEFTLPAHDTIVDRSNTHAADTRNQNLRGIPRDKCSHMYLDTTTKRSEIKENLGRKLKLSRKNGSYQISEHATRQKVLRMYDNASQPHSHYHPSKLTHMAPAKNNKQENPCVRHQVYQQIDAGRERGISTDSSNTDLARLVSNRLRKVYSYYEIVSNSPSTEITPSTNLTSMNTDDTTTLTEIHPAAVTSHLFVEKSDADYNPDKHDVLLQIRNVLSRYFKENCCKGKGNHDTECFKPEKLTVTQRHNDENDKPRETKSRVHQKYMQSPKREKSDKMGLRYCY